jgi:hypothetical protein
MGAENTFRIAALDSRCRFVVGNFFESAPSAGDLVVLSRVLHDFDDEQAVSILRHCRRAIEPAGRILVIEQLVVPSRNRQTNAVVADLQMLATLPGRERTESEFRELFAAAGLQLRTATPTTSPSWLLEAVPQLRVAKLPVMLADGQLSSSSANVSRTTSSRFSDASP